MDMLGASRIDTCERSIEAARHAVGAARAPVAGGAVVVVDPAAFFAAVRVVIRAAPQDHLLAISIGCNNNNGKKQPGTRSE